MTTRRLRIDIPQSPAELAAMRTLCLEYRDVLMGLGPEMAAIVTAAYPRETYARLVARLEHEHAPPTGGLRLASLGGDPVGCGMFHALSPDAAEIKRVYLRPHARGVGAGRALMEALIGDIRAAGFRRILMDTGKPLKAAARLYLSMGFRPRGPYRDVPEIAKDHLLYFEMPL